MKLMKLMKIMTGFLSILLTCMFTNEMISADEITWDQVQVGDTAIRYPKRIIGELVPEIEVTEQECLKLDSELKKLNRTINRCKKVPQGNFCQILEKGLRIFGQDRGSLEDSIGPGIENSWEMATIQGQETFPFDKNIGGFAEGTDIEYGENSFVRKFEEIISLDVSDRIDVKAGKLQTRNKFTACDLQRKRIVVRTSINRNIESTKRSPVDTVDFGWNTYELIRRNRQTFKEDEDEQLVQAALVGYTLGKSIEERRSKDKSDSLSIKGLFKTFFDLEGGEMRLKAFHDKEEFKNQVFPDQTFKSEVSIEWSNL